MLRPLHAQDSAIRAFLPQDFLTTIGTRVPNVGGVSGPRMTERVLVGEVVRYE